MRGIGGRTQGGYDLEGFRMDVLKYLAVDFDIKEEEFQKTSANNLTERLYKEVRDTFSRKTETIAKQAFPVIKNVFEQRGEMFKNIVVPFTMENGLIMLWLILRSLQI